MQRRRSVQPKARPERVWFEKPLDLSGVEVLCANDCQRHWRWYHTTYSVCTPLAFRGVADYMYRARLRSAGCNNQLLMEPGEVHVSKRQTQPATFRVLFVEPEAMARAVEALGGPGVLPTFRGDPIANARLLQAFRRLHAALETPTATQLERQSRFASCLRLLLREAGCAEEEFPPDVARVQRLREYLDAYATEHVSLDDLSALSGLSPFYVAREFKRVAGLPPHAYQVVVRVERARRLLSEGASLHDAARRTGFVDSSHLIRHFRRVTGVTPGSYSGGLSLGCR